MVKTALLLLIGAAALAAGNPAVGVEWRWKARTVTVSPNVKALPFKKVIESNVPKKSLIPGTHVVENCGKSHVNMERIVGGDIATPHAYPWLVALFSDNEYFCAGSIISEEWIMTTAHCIQKKTSIEVVAGAHNIKIDELSQVTIVSREFHTHKHYNSQTAENDIGLIKLPTPLTFTSKISPVCLPKYSDALLEAGVGVTLAGWGLTSESASDTTDVLRYVNRPTITNSDCGVSYGIPFNDDIVCTDASSGSGTCNGDGGSPMTFLGESGLVEARGISAFVHINGCQSGKPDGFTRVISYLDWIELNSGIVIGA